MKDKKVLLSAQDGPEGIEIYTSEDEGIVDWSPSFPAMYILVSINGASVKLGPFTLPSIYSQIVSQLRKQPGFVDSANTFKEVKS